MRNSFLKLFFFCPILLFAQDYKVGDHELIFMPTAYTMPANNSYFTDYEVILLNYTYAITPRTHLGLMTLFPYRDDFYETISLGVKQNYYREGIFQSAAYITWSVENGLLMIGNVFSIGNPENSFHISLAYLTETDTKINSLLYMVGYRVDPSESTSLIFEYSNGQEVKEGLEGKGLLSAVLRVRSNNLSWDIGATKNLEKDDDWFLYPLLKATYYFD